ncbi:unannotated protein [freshwater metagenome]|uniref:Unannotated protein n=1 Tax=freshwater metagenome TaxID=449393 RepID=A0A6J6Y9I5_9ZZZZ
MAEAVHGMSELCLDRWVSRCRTESKEIERVDCWLDLASELFEHEVLVFHLGHEACGLEQTLAVGERAEARCQVGVVQRWVVVERVLQVCHEAVVLVFEDGVNRREANVLIGTAVAGDHVQVEQLVVVARRWAVTADGAEGLSGTSDGVWVRCANWGRSVRDVVEERRVDAADVCRRWHWVGEVALDEAECGHVLGKAVGARNEVAVWVGGDHWDVVDVGVDKLQAELVGSLCLHVGPVGHGAIGVTKQAAGCGRVAERIEFVLAQEHLMRRVRAVCLAEVDPW